MYQLIRPLLFKLEPETAHELVLQTAKLARFEAVAKLVKAQCQHRGQTLSRNVFGLNFKNPIGLAAGFDKNAEMIEFLSALGFGHIEVGTVTSAPQPGNPKPRIFRYPNERALINRMGFPSHGAMVVSERLRRVRDKGIDCILGVNIGKLKTVSLEEATSDYVKTFEVLKECGDYFAVNVSSPNTPELRKLQERSRLKGLLLAIQEKNTRGKPLLVKVSPDLNPEELNDVVECALECKLSGIIATNTTISREGLVLTNEEQGGLSGVPLQARALEIIKLLNRLLSGRLPVIGVGGISSTASALKFFQAGASMIQVYTAMIYEGPLLVARMLRELGHKTGAQTTPTAVKSSTI